MKRLAILILIFSALGLLVGAYGFTVNAQADFVVIVNDTSAIDALSKSQISNLFLMKSTSWNDGSRVRPVDQVSGATVRDSFSEAVHGKSVSAIKSFWQKKIFSGAGTPPPEKRSDIEVIEYVKANPGAIGYVSASVSVEGVKVIEVYN
jgi:ABC-type phosphate transport system substrate-binding protein